MTVRQATPDDAESILSFVQKKAEFDCGVGAFSGILHTSAEKIRKTLFAPSPFAYVLFAELNHHPIGFALYYFRYSSFAGQPSLWLDDLYVDAEYRSRGAGAALMQSLVQIAQVSQCTHLAWTADVRNTRGLNFYQRLGATIVEQRGKTCFLKWEIV